MFNVDQVTRKNWQNSWISDNFTDESDEDFWGDLLT